MDAGQALDVTVVGPRTLSHRDDGSCLANGLEVSIHNASTKAWAYTMEDFSLAHPDSDTAWTHTNDSNTWGPDPTLGMGAKAPLPILFAGTIAPGHSIHGLLPVGCPASPEIELVTFAHVGYGVTGPDLAEWRLTMPSA